MMLWWLLLLLLLAQGDYTRTGERRLAGMMKDGMNSASRYYVNRFKDNVKQLAIDLMLGQVRPRNRVCFFGGRGGHRGG